MILKEENYILNGKNITFRSPEKSDALLLVDYLKTVSGETRFLLCEADEIKYTVDEEEKYIEKFKNDEKSLLLLCFIDGEYAGNCSFEGRTISRRQSHRAEIGIALFQKFTGMGLGRLMLNRLLEIMKTCGLEQAELTVFENNENAIRLYKSLGFTECGRVPNAAKYPDGTYDNEIFMTLKF